MNVSSKTLHKTSAYEPQKNNRRSAFLQGLRDAVPIGLGYLAVSFSLGITARNAGLSIFQGGIASLFCLASAGEYAGFTLIAARAALTELALMTLVINLRYMLMSLALTQKTDPNMPFFHRLIFGAAVTDELFAINIARPGLLDPWYYYGAIAISAPLWALGTSLGIGAGEILPARVVSALSVALYGMFIAIIIPQARKNKVIAALIAICFAASWAAETLPLLKTISSGTKTIILTVIIASVAALLFPAKDDPGQDQAIMNDETAGLGKDLTVAETAGRDKAIMNDEAAGQDQGIAVAGTAGQDQNFTNDRDCSTVKTLGSGSSGEGSDV